MDSILELRFDSQSLLEASLVFGSGEGKILIGRM